MHVGDERVWHGRQDCAGLERVVVRIAPDPIVPQRQIHTGREAEVVCLFLFRPSFLPFEKAVRGNETPAPLESAARFSASY
jgi:hypothetical protein